MVMRTAFKILLIDSTPFDQYMIERAREYWLEKLSEVPRETIERRQVYSALQWSAGVDSRRIRWLFADLGIDPYAS